MKVLVVPAGGIMANMADATPEDQINMVRPMLETEGFDLNAPIEVFRSRLTYSLYFVQSFSGKTPANYPTH